MFLFVFLSCILIPLNKFPLSIFVPKVTWKLDVDIVGPTACVRQGPWRARGRGRGSVTHGLRRAPPSLARIWTQGLATRGNRERAPLPAQGPANPAAARGVQAKCTFKTVALAVVSDGTHGEAPERQMLDLLIAVKH